MYSWGEVEGDHNADRIMQDRKPEHSSIGNSVAIWFVVALGLGGWYIATGSRIALATEIIASAVCAAGWVAVRLAPHYTFMMIAERRIRNVEIQVSNIESRPPR